MIAPHPIFKDLYRSHGHFYIRLHDNEWFSTNLNIKTYSEWTLGIAQGQEMKYETLTDGAKLLILNAYRIHQAKDMKDDFLSLSRLETGVKEPLKSRSWIDDDNE